jgi:hypothetical protein
MVISSPSSQHLAANKIAIYQKKRKENVRRARRMARGKGDDGRQRETRERDKAAFLTHALALVLSSRIHRARHGESLSLTRLDLRSAVRPSVGF